ncbi:hypothetical protein IGI04_005022 [Brassica rapa subsp. trilocularis]|uniref:WPP domain-containing protein n=1 Tax=Brassica rapa subsp. trilocularis TaxID=1813537 RepID=A0ABQ7NDG4_BRACM|nr:hypothetical protein IGI04_005022 [Brassica rapa subsp. trilocularis]
MNLFSNALQGNVLSSLNLSDNALGEKGVRAFGTLLKSLSSLEELYLMNDAVADALKESASPVEVLEMAGNDITSEAASAIAACVAANQDLNKLNLSENLLRDEGCIQIEKSVEEDHSKLQYIDLSNNYIRRDGAVALAGVVMKKEAFKLLNVDGNIISEEGVEEVKEMFKKKQSCLGVWMRMILMEKKEMKRMMSWSQS